MTNTIHTFKDYQVVFSCDQSFKDCYLDALQKTLVKHENRDPTKGNMTKLILDIFEINQKFFISNDKRKQQQPKVKK